MGQLETINVPVPLNLSTAVPKVLEVFVVIEVIEDMSDVPPVIGIVPVAPVASVPAALVTTTTEKGSDKGKWTNTVGG